MHYKNGRPAQNGDKVIFIPTHGAPVVGILYDAVAGNDHCNGRIAPTSLHDAYPNLKECLHVDDVKASAYPLYGPPGVLPCYTRVVPSGQFMTDPGNISATAPEGKVYRGVTTPGSPQTVGAVTFNATTEVKPDAI